MSEKLADRTRKQDAARPQAAPSSGVEAPRALESGQALLGDFTQLSLVHEPALQTLWCLQRHPERPNFTPALLQDLLGVLRYQRDHFQPDDPAEDWGFRYWILGSETPGVFNLGGDLSLFVDFVQGGRRAEMFEYAKACIDACFTNYVNNDLPIVSIAAIEGDALGGGLEAALSCDVVIAESGVKLGFPEILFGLFPGMGAFNFAAKKIGAKAAQTLILEGRIFEAEELHEIGLVDYVAPPGGARAAVRKYIRNNNKNFRAIRAIRDVHRLTDPITYDEMIKIGEYWVDAAMRLRDIDLRKMARLARAQSGRLDRELSGAE